MKDADLETRRAEALRMMVQSCLGVFEHFESMDSEYRVMSSPEDYFLHRQGDPCYYHHSIPIGIAVLAVGDARRSQPGEEACPKSAAVVVAELGVVRWTEERRRSLERRDRSYVLKVWLLELELGT